MNEKLQYASMLDIPISTSSVSAITKKKKVRKKKRINDELVKEKLLKKINQEQDLLDVLDAQTSLVAQENNTSVDFYGENQIEVQESLEQNTSNVFVSSKRKNKKPFKFTIVGFQLMIIGLLVATILLTNALYENSGINVFLRGVFGSDVTQVDTREHVDFSPIISMGDNSGVIVSDGVITFAGEGSVYAPCDGIVKNIVETQTGRYDIEIEHSQNFKSIISGVERIYVSQGDTVYSNIPVGYLEPDGATICFTDSEGELLDGYQMVGNMVVWQA